VSDHATVTIKVTDVNDNKPVFSQSTYNATMSENMNSGTVVVQVTATDKDMVGTGKWLFSFDIKALISDVLGDVVIKITHLCVNDISLLVLYRSPLKPAYAELN